MIKIRKTLPLAAALLLLTPSCVVALGNKSASPHPHKDCPICSHEAHQDQASADHSHELRRGDVDTGAILADDQPALAARQ